MVSEMLVISGNRAYNLHKSPVCERGRGAQAVYGNGLDM